MYAKTNPNRTRNFVLTAQAALIVVMLIVAGIRQNWLGQIQTAIARVTAPTQQSAANFAIAPTAGTANETFDADAVSNNGTLAILIDNGHYVPVGDFKLTTGSHTIVIKDGKYYVADFATNQLFELRRIEINAAVAPTSLATLNPIIRTGIITDAQGEMNTEGFYGPVTAEAQTALGLNVQRLRSEPSAWVFRVPNDDFNTVVRCPAGFICTIHRRDGIFVYVGEGVGEQALTFSDTKAGTFRYIRGYPMNDDVREIIPLRLLAKEQKFGAQEVPSFTVSAGNFSVTGAQQAAPTVISGNTSNGDCGIEPAKASTVEQAACLLFGADKAKDMAQYVTIKPNTNGSGFYYSGPSATFHFPGAGRVDGDGWQLDSTNPDATNDGVVATWWRDA